MTPVLLQIRNDKLLGEFKVNPLHLKGPGIGDDISMWPGFTRTVCEKHVHELAVEFERNTVDFAAAWAVGIKTEGYLLFYILLFHFFK